MSNVVEEQRPTVDWHSMLAQTQRSDGGLYALLADDGVEHVGRLVVGDDGHQDAQVTDRRVKAKVEVLQHARARHAMVFFNLHPFARDQPRRGRPSDTARRAAES